MQPDRLKNQRSHLPSHLPLRTSGCTCNRISLKTSGRTCLCTCLYKPAVAHATGFLQKPAVAPAFAPAFKNKLSHLQPDLFKTSSWISSNTRADFYRADFYMNSRTCSRISSKTSGRRSSLTSSASYFWKKLSVSSRSCHLATNSCAHETVNRKSGKIKNSLVSVFYHLATNSCAHETVNRKSGKLDSVSSRSCHLATNSCAHVTVNRKSGKLKNSLVSVFYHLATNSCVSWVTCKWGTAYIDDCASQGATLQSRLPLSLRHLFLI